MLSADFSYPVVINHFIPSLHSANRIEISRGKEQFFRKTMNVYKTDSYIAAVAKKQSFQENRCKRS